MLDIIGANECTHSQNNNNNKKQSWLCRPDHMFFKGYNAHTMHHFFFSLECCAGAAAAVEQAVKLGQHSGNKAFSFVGLAY
jgi:hypothetical protein